MPAGETVRDILLRSFFGYLIDEFRSSIGHANQVAFLRRTGPDAEDWFRLKLDVEDTQRRCSAVNGEYGK